MNEIQNRKESFGMNKLSWLDKLIYALRVRTIEKYAAKSTGKVIMDVGCWFNAVFLRYVQGKYAPQQAIAYDLVLNHSELTSQGISCIEGDLNKPLTVDLPVDVIFATAILEHLSEPVAFLKECYRCLAPDGCLLLTTPSIRSQPVLEFLAYKLKLISAEEIEDHKDYYDKKKLMNYFIQAWFSEAMTKHTYFECYMNNLVVAYKKN